VTSPQDPFSTPPPGGQPRSEPYQTPDPDTTPYGTSDGGSPDRSTTTGPAYGAPAYGAPAYGSDPAQQQYGQPYGQQQYGQPYTQQQHGSVQRGPARNGLGVAALVLGILGLLTSWIFVGGVLGLIAIVLGVMGRGRAKRGEATNGGMALTGIITGALAVIVAAVVTIGAVALFNSEEFSTVRECLADAGDDQAAIEACAEQFE
jgi:hypothetical protein